MPERNPSDELDEAVEAEDVERTMLSRFVDVQAPLPADAMVWRRELVERALVPDITYERAGAVLRKAYDPPFFVTCYQGLDVVGHAFTRFARPERFGLFERGGRALDQFLRFHVGGTGFSAGRRRAGDRDSSAQSHHDVGHNLAKGDCGQTRPDS